jgi:23S rRNA pseudouridine1911/1915/1917 synthase
MNKDISASDDVLEDGDADEIIAPTSANSSREIRIVVGEDTGGQRIDLYLTLQCNGYSRMFLRGVINQGLVCVDGRPVKPAFKVFPGQVIHGTLPPPPSDGSIPEDIPLDILFEDEYLVAVNKPAGMVVHPAKGHWKGTLTAALAHHFQQLSDCGGPTRPGIVHRLDRETSGVICIAKTNEVHFKLSAQFESREVQKEYRTIVIGNIDRDRDWIRQPIGYHPYQREKMAIRAGHESSRDAETFFEIIERFHGYAYLKVLPKTGRTHQIRVHLSHIGAAVLCDRLYGGHARATRGQLLRRQAQGQPLQEGDQDVVIDRQALHAHRIEFAHPITRSQLTIEAPLPPDFENVLAILRSTKQTS